MIIQIVFIKNFRIFYYILFFFFFSNLKANNWPHLTGQHTEPRPKATKSCNFPCGLARLPVSTERSFRKLLHYTLLCGVKFFYTYTFFASSPIQKKAFCPVTYDRWSVTKYRPQTDRKNYIVYCDFFEFFHIILKTVLRDREFSCPLPRSFTRPLVVSKKWFNLIF